MLRCTSARRSWEGSAPTTDSSGERTAQGAGKDPRAGSREDETRESGRDRNLDRSFADFARCEYSAVSQIVRRLSLSSFRVTHSEGQKVDGWRSGAEASRSWAACDAPQNDRPRSGKGASVRSARRFTADADAETESQRRWGIDVRPRKGTTE